ncbi:MAG: VOC family protein [Treponema sp.]|jgi:catechol 2,3-dioxygenase-like lactoylglutathione lyase family enzyme|nr:VOC family protein [Treponema sp.]
MAIDKTKVVQIGILARDVKETTAVWCKFLGLEMPEIFKTDGYEKTRAWFKGGPCHGLIYQSMFNFNNIQVEIIQPVDGTPSIWRECLDRDGEGLHHISFAVKNMPAAIGEAESLGFPLIQKGEYTGGRYAYMDAIGSMKIILEFLEND